ncbi:MAG: hypothetical protein IJC20_00115 [Clostridia bacterium]|nr:hypothetical protein [Clostridia bacterium]
MKLLIISDRESDLSRLLSQNNNCDILNTVSAENADLSQYDSIAVLGGNSEKPLIFKAVLREKLEKFANCGKKIFLEYVNSFRCVYSAQPTQIFSNRLVACEDITDEIKLGDLMDSHYNQYIKPHFLMPNTIPLMYYHKHTPAHDNLGVAKEEIEKGDIALFRYDNMLTACFRLCDYLKAAFAPKIRWDSLVNYICEFLNINSPSFFPENALTTKRVLTDSFQNELDNCINRALNLLCSYLVTEDGSKGIYEGASHNIHPDGRRIRSDIIRTDCVGETAGAFLFSEDEKLVSCAEKMYDLCYGPLTVHGGEYKGMVRWTEEAWEVCYQDDVARAIIPSLLYSYFGYSDKYLKNACEALDFLCKTTCKDGLRPARTDVLEYLKSGKSIYSLKNDEQGYASAHYNSWYSAALLLGYLTAKKEEYKEVGIKGLETLMSLYPDTVREHSETSELCRLIFPLALLYKVSGEKKHYDMLNRVFTDLQNCKHVSYGYAEWDTGYKAVCFNNADGECSLLSKNGDAVADLLYSVNWLPLGFAFAYHVTDEERFLDAFEKIAEFFIKTQIVSDDDMTDGAWCRGIDLDRLEYVGIPHDVGWGPCCIETGWTVAEITMGLLIGRKILTNNKKHNFS